MLRWLNPFKLIKDLKFLFKNFGNIRKIFTSLFKFDFKGALGAFNKLLAGMGGIFKRGIGRVVKRLLLKVFGKGLTKIASSLFKTAGRGAAQLFKKVPIIGPIIGFGINLALGDPVGKAAFKAVAGALVGFIGGAIGSVASLWSVAIHTCLAQNTDCYGVKLSCHGVGAGLWYATHSNLVGVAWG